MLKGMLALVRLSAYGADMINPGRRRFELLGLLCKREAAPRGRGRSTDPFWFNGARRTFQTADMRTEAEKTSISRNRSKIYRADRLVQEIGL